jgi:vacuolar-type H+-ATPase subunit H
MPKEVVVEIRETEIEAETLIEKARQDTGASIEKAKADIQQGMADKLQTFEQEVEKSVKKARTDAERTASRQLERAKNQIKKDEAAAKRKIPAATAKVVKTILGE